MKDPDYAARVSTTPFVERYHSGRATGATRLFTERPDLLAWVRNEVKRLSIPIMRGQPPQEDRVSVVHRKAYQKMLDEFDNKASE